MHSLDRARSGAIWGDIWVDMSGYAYPESHWNDMAVALLVELLDAVESLDGASDKQARVRFFDGPFWIDLAGRGDGALHLSVRIDGVERQEAVDLGELRESLKRVGGELATACVGRGWGDEQEVRRLQAKSKE
ncbi:hypothetical protein [Streptomyces sp. YIM 130001]|uniref:hypothetical protein n=1 Tax=Streptomyces sp. YIM 130001 TaxID=2259644 RepID=UPI0013C40DA6|nr:hypothetical protein [Streptomyces sp. YIM 130001]